MDWQTVALLTVLLTGVGWAHARTLARRRRVLLLLWLLAAFLLGRWASYRGTWPEVGVAAAGAVGLLGLWWLLRGRYLPPPSDDNIRVWSEEDPFE